MTVDCCAHRMPTPHFDTIYSNSVCVGITWYSMSVCCGGSRLPPQQTVIMPRQHWVPHSLLFTGYREWFPGAQRPMCDVYNSQTSTGEINKDWNYVSVPPICLDRQMDIHDTANGHLVTMHRYVTCVALVWKRMPIMLYLFQCQQTVKFKPIFS
jgi:hypothetical protein